MRVVSLAASGYTWTCPECGFDNYTGAAPRQVVCARCQAQFEVARMRHRMAASQDGQLGLFDAGEEGDAGVEPKGEIPF